MDRWRVVLNRLDSVFSGAERLDQVFADLDSVISNGFRENFDARVDETGSAWPPHSPSTVKRYGPHPLLVLSGRMKRAATNVADGEHLSERQGDTLIVGIAGSVRYAIFHRTGTSRMPRRNVIFASQKTLGRCRTSIERGVMRLVTRP